MNQRTNSIPSAPAAGDLPPPSSAFYRFEPNAPCGIPVDASPSAPPLAELSSGPSTDYYYRANAPAGVLLGKMQKLRPSALPVSTSTTLTHRISQKAVGRSVLRTIQLCIKILIYSACALLNSLVRGVRSRPEDFIQMKQGGKCYIDMGELYGTWVMGNAMTWWPLPVHIDQTAVDHFLSQMFSQLQKAGITQVNLAFAQIQDIARLMMGLPGSPDDTITPIFADQYKVGTTNQNFLKYFNEAANQAGISVDLSFGGANATAEDMAISQQPQQQAEDLAAFLGEYSISSVDFDIEGATVDAIGNDPNAPLFFLTLHQALKAQGKTSTVTLAGSLPDGPTGPLKNIFSNFGLYFDQVNLMLYSSTQYYLDADNVTWGIKQWLQQVGGDPSKLSIGFYDSIAYENPSASAGTQYDIPKGLTRGQAAAYIYQTLCSNLKLSPADFSPPFWWTDDPMKISTNSVLVDFNTYLGLRMQAVGDNPVYDQYLAYCQLVDTDIDTLRGNKNYWPNEKAVEALISQIVKLQANLAVIEQKDINGSLQTFISDCAATMNAINSCYQQALNIMNDSRRAQQIQQDYQTAQGLISALSGGISTNAKQLTSLSTQQSTIQTQTIPQLQAAIERISDPANKQKALALIATLTAQNNQLGTDISTAQPLLTTLEDELEAIQQPGSVVSEDLNTLQQLASLANPTAANVQQADATLASIQENEMLIQAQTNLTNFQETEVKTLNADITAIQASIAAINALLPGKRIEIYSDNWAIPDGYLPMPNIPTTAAIDYAFGEPLMDWQWLQDPQNPQRNIWQVVSQSSLNGTWAANFAGGFPVNPSNIIGTLLPRMPDALAIGGWNTSQQTPGFDITNPSQPYAYQENNLFQIMSSPTQANRDAFRANIVATAVSGGYKTVIMDYENYSHGHQEGTHYTDFLIALEKDLLAQNPPVSLSMAVSPSAKNQDYYDLQQLVSNTNITFEPMCYDYALGISPLVVTPNAAVGQTEAYLKAMVAAGVPANRMKIGFSTYGVAFNLPYGTTLAQVLSGLKQLNGLPFSSYWNGQCPVGTANGGNGQISNDQIFQMIGGSGQQNPWQPTAAGWQAISYYNPNQPNYPAEVLYFHPTAGNNGCPVVISAQTGSAVQAISTLTGKTETVPAALENLVKLGNTDPALSGNLGYFGWDAMEDENSVSLNAVLAADAMYY